MLCLNGHENIEQAKYCATCGSPLRNSLKSKNQSAMMDTSVLASDRVAATEPVHMGHNRRRLFIGLAVAVAALVVTAIVVIASGHHAPTHALTSSSTATTPTNDSSGSTTATFLPSTTVPTSGLVQMSLTLWDCPTTLGVSGESPANLTTPVQVMVPSGYSSNQLAVYTDNQGIMELLAPANWHCQATVGADGSSSIQIYPPNQDAASNSALASDSSIQEVSGDQTSASQFSATEQACQLFVTANKALGGETCNMHSSPQEEASSATPNIVEFTDPPGVVGDADPSGGSYTASGVMTYYPRNNNGSWTETCVLSPSESSLCAAILASFIASYGSN
jgi:hypothetical protein